MTDFPKWVRERAAELVTAENPNGPPRSEQDVLITWSGHALCRHIMEHEKEPEDPMVTAVRSALVVYETAKGSQSNALRVHDGHYDDLVLLVVDHLRSPKE